MKRANLVPRVLVLHLQAEYMPSPPVGVGEGLPTILYCPSKSMGTTNQ